MTLLFLAIGLGAGVLSGLFGIGGGVVIVPALIYLAKYQPQQAAGTSLAALVLPVGLLGAITYYKAGFIDIRPALVMALGLFLGAAIGAKFATQMDGHMLKRAFAVLLVAMAVKMWVD